MPGFVLGAMLPDFATMSETRLAEVDHPELSAGIALHHRTDRVFHAAPHFLGLCREATRSLAGAGTRKRTRTCRGPRGNRAAARRLVGETAEGYERPTRPPCVADATRSWDRQIRWLDEDGTRALAFRLRRRLEKHGPPEDYRDPTLVASTVERILRGRPRLALDARRAKSTARYLPELQQVVNTHAAGMSQNLLN